MVHAILMKIPFKFGLPYNGGGQKLSTSCWKKSNVRLYYWAAKGD
jgi:hypothetical protein